MAKGRFTTTNKKKNDTGANLGLEATLWQAADALHTAAGAPRAEE